MAERRITQLKAKIKRDTSAYPVKLKPQKAQELCYAAYDNALRLNGDNAMVLNNYAYFLSEEERDLGKALEMSSKAIKLTQNNSTFLDTHAWILYLLDRKEEARTFMRQALSLDSEGNATLMLHYGDILFSLGEKFMAETYWKKALDAGAEKAEVERRLEYSKTNASGVKIHNVESKRE
jgi:tetratricopeptide (TPR) repeat protein